MPASSSKEAQLANFVFKGTVKKLKAATMKNVEVNDRTAIVTVDQILEAPKNLASYGGQNLTVQLSGRQKVKVGQEMIFHANGVIWGDSVMVQSVSQEAVKKTHAALLSRGGDPVEHKANRDLRKRFDEADVVVSGKVTAVRLPSGAAGAPSRAARIGAVAETAARPVSEHDPKWREAVVEVDRMHKGVHSKKTIVVRFPASIDVKWYKAPKFHPGQQGLFMLKRAKAEEGVTQRPGERAALGAEPEVKGAEVYTALHPTDFQPHNQPGGIRALIEAARDESKP